MLLFLWKYEFSYHKMKSISGAGQLVLRILVVLVSCSSSQQRHFYMKSNNSTERNNGIVKLDPHSCVLYTELILG